MNRISTSCIAGLATLVLAVPSLAEEGAPTAEAAREMPALMAGAEAMAEATVEAIDKENRVVTLRRTDGALLDVVAGDEVRNFDQIEVGDSVVVEHTVGLMMTLSPADTGVAERVDVLEAGRAEPGQKPAGVVRKTIEATGTVQAVDREARTVTLKGAKRAVTLPVAEDIDLGAFEVGDRVDAVYQESLAISVQPARAEE